MESANPQATPPPSSALPSTCSQKPEYWDNPIVDEIYRIREEHAAKFNYDVRAMFEELKNDEERWRAQGYKFVDLTKGQKP